MEHFLLYSFADGTFSHLVDIPLIDFSHNAIMGIEDNTLVWSQSVDSNVKVNDKVRNWNNVDKNNGFSKSGGDQHFVPWPGLQQPSQSAKSGSEKAGKDNDDDYVWGGGDSDGE